jgi:predicted membrane metal-binding protein
MRLRRPAEQRAFGAGRPGAIRGESMASTKTISRERWLEIRRLGRARFVLANGLPHGIVGAIFACAVSYLIGQKALSIYLILAVAMILFAFVNSLMRWNEMAKRFVRSGS